MNHIYLTYEIILPFGEKFIYQEIFKPYFRSKLKMSWFLQYMGKSYSALFLKKDNLELKIPEYERPNAELALEVQDMSNILMDGLYCIAQIYGLSYFSPFDYRFSLQKYDLFNEWIFDRTSFLKYIGCYTELIKNEICEIKFAISALVNLYNDENFNEELARSFLKKIANEFSLPIKTNANIYDSIKDTLLCFCDYRNFQNQQNNFKIEIDLLKFDRFISLLKKYKPYTANLNKQGTAIDFINDHNCFCLAKGVKNYYFSISGYGTDYDNLGDKIKQDLNSYFTSSMFQYCSINDEMLNYVYEKAKNKYKPLKTPIKLKDVKIDYTAEDIRKYYSCCERKIFCNTVEKEFTFYCKYEPCQKCIPAINAHNVLHFFALIKDSSKLKKILKKKHNDIKKQSKIKTLF